MQLGYACTPDLCFIIVIYETVLYTVKRVWRILDSMRLELIFGVHRATHRIGLYIQRHAPDLTQADAHILCHLHESGESPISGLHQAFAHKRSTLTSVLDRLESRGLIRRESSREDRRSFIVRLTPPGKKKAAKIHRQLVALEAGVLSGSDAETVETFGRVIRALEDMASEEKAVGRRKRLAEAPAPLGWA